jgi:hypothetical protein
MPMSLSGWIRAAWVAVPAALVCGGAVAQQIIPIPSGVVVILSPGDVPGAAKAPVLVESPRAVPEAALPVSIERVFAEQQAMMDRMMADMNAMFSPSANPRGLIQAMMGSSGSLPAASGTYCEESVSVSYNGHDAKPVVKVSRAGTGCGPVPGAAPVPAVTAPPVQREPRVLNISNPPEPPRVQHRT